MSYGCRQTRRPPTCCRSRASDAAAPAGHGRRVAERRDITHTVLNGTGTRQGLYVALSRARRTNDLYLATPTASLDTVRPGLQDTAVDPRQVLTDILAPDGRAHSATTAERGDTAQLLREAVLAHQDALPVLAQDHLGQERMTALDDALERWLPGLTGQPAYPHLRGQLAQRWVDGTPPQTVIEWPLGTAAPIRSARPTTPPPPSPGAAPGPPHHHMGRAPALAARRPTGPTTPAGHKDYLDRLTDRIDGLKQRVEGEAHQAGAADRMPWQRTLPADIDDQLIGDLAVWRAAQGILPTDPSPVGPPMKEPEAARDQTRLVRRLGPPPATSSTRTADAAREKLRATGRLAERHTFYEHPGRRSTGPSR